MTSDPAPESSTTDIEGRSEVARFLGKEVWPADRSRLLSVARENSATDAVVSRLSALPDDVTFQNMQEVSEQLGLATAEHEGPGAD